MKLFHASILAAAIFLSSCSGTPEIESRDEALPHNDSGVVLSVPAVESIGILLGTIEQRSLARRISAQGELFLLPKDEASATVMIPGILLDIAVEFGQRVSKGQQLASYTSHEFLEMQLLYLNTKASLEKVSMDHNRQKVLWDKGVISEKEYQQSLLEYNRALADYNASLAEMEMLHVDLEKLERGEFSESIAILSPISGRVEEVTASLGQFINLGDQVMRIIDETQPVLRIKVFEKDIQYIRKGQRVSFAIPGNESDQYSGSIVNLGSRVDPFSRVVQVQARIDSMIPGFLPGMFVSTTIHSDERVVDALPLEAILTESGDKKYGFYTLNPEENSSHRIFYPIGINTGLEGGGYIEVVPAYPLPESAQFVVSGTYYLKSEMRKNADE